MTETEMQVTSDNDKVYVTWSDGQVSRYDNIWLRDLCQCEHHFHPLTRQRLQNTFEIPEDVHASGVKFDGDAVSVEWAHDGHVSNYSLDWLKLHSYDPVLVTEKTSKLAQTFWDGKDIEKNLPTVTFDQVMQQSDDGVAEWTSKIYEHGFCMISGTPVDPEHTEKLCERLAYIRPTHYGGFWDFTADLAKKDTAYTNLHLACHTDGTYWSDTPGLQLFHMLGHDGEGGETMLADGFKAAETLRRVSPESYELLSNLRIPAHSAGEESVCITPTTSQPVFTHDESGDLVQVRWNNDDRSVMDKWSDPADVTKFYKAIRIWNKILLDNQFVLKLVPGTCLIFDNWRVLHGRMGFHGQRRMCGAYINRDDYVSRAKILNLGRDEVLKTL